MDYKEQNGDDKEKKGNKKEAFWKWENLKDTRFTWIRKEKWS